MAEGVNASVAVVGGGCAGLAAAVTLAQAQIPVTLYEASPHLGGRARTVEWRGLAVDNGQHIMLGAYHQTLKLMQLAGVNLQEAILRTPLRLDMHGALQLKACATLPAPLHILYGFLSAQGLTWADKIACVRLMLWMRLRRFHLPQDSSLLDILRNAKQSDRLIKILWEPLCLAALNTPIAQASAQVFMHVLRDSFAQTKSDSDMLFPRWDLSRMLINPLARYIQQQGGQIHLNTPVTSIISESQGYHLHTATGVHIHRHVVLAVSPFRLAALTQDLPHFSAVPLLKDISHQPIYTVYLQYAPDKTLGKPMLGLVDTLSQWVIDRGYVAGQKGLLAVVISAQGAHQTLAQSALADQVIAELQHAFPHLGHPIWYKVIAEKRATFSCQACMYRPTQRTALANLYLAGDYTAGDYPATIEGAVQSGVKCATLIQATLN